MTVFNRLASLLLVLIMLPLTVQAAEPGTDALERRLINYYHHYQEDARLDCELILEQMEAQDPAFADTWVNILDFWSGVNSDMQFHSGVLPDGLPEDDSLCIVVMGYYLEADGDMRDELIQRMHVTLDSAEKYPNAYIMCTGGGTASGSSKVTEAGQMAKWLKKKGIDPDRIIVEDQALSTIQNATYGCALLYRDYPQVRNLAVITSDYHIYRSCLYFHVQAALDAYDLGIEPMKVISNASCRVNPGASRDLDRQTEGVGMLTKQKDVEKDDPEPLTKLDRITVAGQSEYVPGGQLNLTVTAHYSNGYDRNVTKAADFSGFDMDAPGFHEVKICYDEWIESFDIYVIPPETGPPAVVPGPAEPEPATEPVPEPQYHALPLRESSGLWIALALLTVCVCFLLILKARRARKRRRRPRPTIKLD